MYTLESVSSVANFITAYEESVSKGIYLRLFYCTAAGVSAVWRR